MNLNIKSLGDADKAKRHQLTRLVKDVQRVFPDDEDVTRLQMVEGLLSQDGTSKDIRKDCEERIGMLKDDECCILVSGLFLSFSLSLSLSLSLHRSLKLCPYITYIASKPKAHDVIT